MKAKLYTREVGPYSMNTYVVVDGESGKSAIIDPGGDSDIILEMTSGTKVEKILITHGHGDHVMALDEIKRATSAPVFLHPADGVKFNLSYDTPLKNGVLIPIGSIELKVIHVPGHTPGQCCFDLGDHRIVVGDTIFVGGPGHTATPEDFELTMENMVNIVFKWPDETIFYPGHGPSGMIGSERHSFQAFVTREWPEDTHGDVTWE